MLLLPGPPDVWDSISAVLFWLMVAMLVGVFLNYGYRVVRNRYFVPPLFIPLLSLVFYGLYEWCLAGKGYDIRVDLLLIWPLLLVTGIIAVVQQITAPKPKSNIGWDEAPRDIT